MSKLSYWSDEMGLVQTFPAFMAFFNFRQRKSRSLGLCSHVIQAQDDVNLPTEDLCRDTKLTPFQLLCSYWLFRYNLLHRHRSIHAASHPDRRMQNSGIK
jgi:hypothetical protein